MILLVALVATGSAEAKKIKGFIIFGRDTVEVTFKVSVGLFASEPSLERMQYKVIYYDGNGKRNVLRPDMAKEIRFAYKGKEIRMLSRSTLGIDFADVLMLDTDIFLKIEVDGPVKLFRFYSTRQSGGNMNPTTGMMTGTMSYSVERFLLQKGSGMLKRPKTLTFRKDMKEYFGDCPELVSKIESKEFTKNELFSIVSFYNAQCKKR